MIPSPSLTQVSADPRTVRPDVADDDLSTGAGSRPTDPASPLVRQVGSIHRTASVAGDFTVALALETGASVAAYVDRLYAPLLDRITARNFYHPALATLSEEAAARFTAGHVEAARTAFAAMVDDVRRSLSGWEPERLKAALAGADTVDSVTSVWHGMLNASMFAGVGRVADSAAPGLLVFLRDELGLDEAWARAATSTLLSAGVVLADATLTPALTRGMLTAEPYYQMAYDHRLLHPALRDWLAHFRGRPPGVLQRTWAFNTRLLGYDIRNAGAIAGEQFALEHRVEDFGSDYEAVGGLAIAGPWAGLTNIGQRRSAGEFGVHVLLARTDAPRLLRHAAMSVYHPRRIAVALLRNVANALALPLAAALPPVLVPRAFGGLDGSRLDSVRKRWMPDVLQQLLRPSTAGYVVGLSFLFGYNSFVKHLVARSSAGTPVQRQFAADTVNLLNKSVAYYCSALGVEGADALFAMLRPKRSAAAQVDPVDDAGDASGDDDDDPCLRAPLVDPAVIMS